MKHNKSIIRQAFTYKNSLEAYAFSIIQDWGLAEDAVQEALIQVSDKSDTLDEKGLLNWMKTVTHRRAVDILRRRNKNVYNESLVDAVNQAFDKQLDESVVKKDCWRREVLDFCLRQVDEKARSLILAFYLDGKNTDELSKEFGKSANSIRIQLYRMREVLRKCVAKSKSLA